MSENLLLPVVFRNRRLPKHPKGQTSMCMVHHDRRVPGKPPESWESLSAAEQLAWSEQHFTPDEWKQARKNLHNAIMAVNMYFPFFGVVLTNIATKQIWVTREEERVKLGPDWRTMATDGSWLYIWPQFSLYHTPFEQVGVIMHEIMHNILMHPERGIGFDHQLANIAKDYVVNLMVNDMARSLYNLGPKTFPISLENIEKLPFVIPNWKISLNPDQPVVGPQDTAYLTYYVDDRWRNEDHSVYFWEKVYHQLQREASQQGGGGGQGGAGDNGQLMDGHGVWKVENRPADEDGQINGESFDPQKIRDAVLDAYTQTEQEQYGRLPAAMRRYFDEMMNPPLPWQRLLTPYLRATPFDVHFAPGDIRFPYPMPAMVDKPELTNIFITFDVSGSMGVAEIGESIGNARAILRGFPGTQGWAMFWDADVHEIIELDKFDGVIRDTGFTGGGGTSWAPQFEMIKKMKLDKTTSVVVSFTDGMLDWNVIDPTTLPYDVICVLTNDRHRPPEHRRYKYTRMEVR